jgi:hypothetical protein
MGGLGIMAALQRRAQFGGSYLIQVSLLQSANFLQSLGTQPEAVVQKLWKNYRADSTDLNPEADLVGVMVGSFSSLFDGPVDLTSLS